MIPDWHWLLGRLEQDEALDKFDAAVKGYEEARNEWYKAVFWANFSSMHRN
jgi:hypothetical protein